MNRSLCDFKQVLAWDLFSGHTLLDVSLHWTFKVHLVGGEVDQELRADARGKRGGFVNRVVVTVGADIFEEEDAVDGKGVNNEEK